MANNTSLWDQMMGGKSADEAADYINRLREKQTAGLEDYNTGAISADDLNEVTPQELNEAKFSARKLGALPEQSALPAPEELPSTQRNFKLQPKLDTIATEAPIKQLELGVEPGWEGRAAADAAPKFKNAEEALKAEEVLQHSKYQDALNAFKKANPETTKTVKDITNNSTYIDDLKDLLTRLKVGTSSKIAEGTGVANEAASSINPKLLNAMEYMKGLPNSKLGRTVSEIAPKIGTGLGALGTAIDARQALEDLSDNNKPLAALGGIKTGLSAGATMGFTPMMIAQLAEQAGEYMPKIAGGDQYTQSERDRLQFEHNKKMEDERAKGINIAPPVNAPNQTTPILAEFPDYKDTVPMGNSREPSSKNSPSKSDVVAHIIQSAKERDIDPTLALAQMEQESNFKPHAISSTGAKGIGQMFPAAFEDSKKMDTTGTLKNLSYEDLNKPENWKQQIDSSMNYLNWIKKNKTTDQDDESALRYYVAGGDPEKAKASGTDPDKYIQSIKNKQEKWKSLLGDEESTEEPVKEPEANRSPALSSIPSSEDIDKLSELGVQSATEQPIGEKEKSLSQSQTAAQAIKDAQDAMSKYAAKQTPKSTLVDPNSPVGTAPLDFGPYRNTEEGRDLYAKSLASQLRLLKPEEEQTSGGAESKSSPEQEQLKTLITAAKDNGGMNNLMLQALRDKSANTTQANMFRALSQVTTGLAGMGGKGRNVAAKNESDKYFEDLVKQAGEPVENVKLQIAASKEDPNSPASLALKGLLEQELARANMKVDLSGMAYNQLKDIHPNITKLADRLAYKEMHTQEMKLKTTTKEEEQADKEMGKVGDNLRKIDISSSRGNVGKAKSLVNQADRLFALIGNDPKKFNDLSEGQVYELAGGMDAMINTQSTVTGRESVAKKMDSLAHTLATIGRKASNKPIGAQAGAFVEQMYDTIKRERDIANSQLQSYFNKVKEGISDKTANMREDKIKRLFDAYSNDTASTMFYDNATEHGIRNFMNTNKISRDEAVKVLKEKGLIN